ncbi:hypothetical protein ACOMHN_016900 [Nucella lapillus]
MPPQRQCTSLCPTHRHGEYTGASPHGGTIPQSSDRGLARSESEQHSQLIACQACWKSCPCGVKPQCTHHVYVWGTVMCTVSGGGMTDGSTSTVGGCRT